MVDKRNTYRILLEKSLINWLPGRVLRTWEGNVRVDTEETGCEALKLSNVAEGCLKGKHWY
jgi:hypothetical protein